ncbi:MAG: N-acetylmuramoyl-L-alanine amidase [Candidatus Omnitrophica bacterium]|nr:N-acetylmuramoyl-L-alanine amidase [Candidatus Omnitrophota bacterium]
MRKIIVVSLMLLLLVGTAQAQAQYFWIKGYKYYPLYSVCRGKDIDYDWDSSGRIATLKKNGVEAKIRIGSDRILIDGKKLEDIGPPIYFHKGMVVIPSSFAKRGIDRIFKEKRTAYRARRATARKSAVSHNTIRTIVLDPGHGGKDPGAIGRYHKLREKDINLDIAKRLKRLLSNRGMKVYLTREKDVSMSLEKRAAFAKRKGADFFISIHANSSRSKWLRGFEVYHLSERTDDNERAKKAAKNQGFELENGSIGRYDKTTNAIAYDLQFTENRIVSKDLARCLLKAVRKDAYVRKNSLRSARFHVLKNIKTDMPAILVEVGYLSNKKEEGLLRLSSYRDKIAEGLKRGILAYKGEYEKADGFTR